MGTQGERMLQVLCVCVCVCLVCVMSNSAKTFLKEIRVICDMMKSKCNHLNNISRSS